MHNTTWTWTCFFRSVRLESLCIPAQSVSTCGQPHLSVIRADRVGRDCTEGATCDRERLINAFFFTPATHLGVLPLGSGERSVIHQKACLLLQPFHEQLSCADPFVNPSANCLSDDTHRRTFPVCRVCRSTCISTAARLHAALCMADFFFTESYDDFASITSPLGVACPAAGPNGSVPGSWNRPQNVLRKLHRVCSCCCGLGFCTRTRAKNTIQLEGLPQSNTA